MELNVDVICCVTGEVLKEGVTLTTATEFITKKVGRVVSTDVQRIDLDDIDGGGQMEVKSLWVEIPEVVEAEIKRDSELKNARKFWQYENGGGQVRK